ncbi:MAG: rhodanese-like domain-containing protein [Sandaracinaceae bacterium]|nr:rhodanese-like domain-containing protein [Sandaracinaceae bacterium]
MDVALPANFYLGIRWESVTGEVKETPRWAPVERNLGGVPELPPEWVAAHLGEVEVIDVREAEELVSELGHIDGVRHVPLARVKEEAVKWDRKQPIITVCRSGGRSGKAALELEAMGFEKVASMRGGMMEWNRMRFPISRAPVTG